MQQETIGRPKPIVYVSTYQFLGCHARSSRVLWFLFLRSLLEVLLHSQTIQAVHSDLLWCPSSLRYRMKPDKQEEQTNLQMTWSIVKTKFT